MAEPPVLHDTSLVVPTLGRELLRTCLRSVVQGTAWPCELLVVDQGSNDEVDTWVGELWASGLNARRIRSNRTGIAAAINLGLQGIPTPFAAVTHDDCRVAPDWLERLALRLRTSGDVLLTGRVEPEGEGIVVTIKTSRRPATYTHPRLDGEVLFPLNMGFPMRLVERVGLLDEHPSLRLAGEDNDWAYRLLRAGIPIVYDPDLVVWHFAWQQSSDLYPLYRRYAYGQGSFYGKHVRRGDAFIILRTLRDAIRAPWLLLRGLLTHNPDLIAMGKGELAGLYAGIVAGLRRDPSDSASWVAAVKRSPDRLPTTGSDRRAQ
jgi:GT2 family glycosyltransferase